MPPLFLKLTLSQVSQMRLSALTPTVIPTPHLILSNVHSYGMVKRIVDSLKIDFVTIVNVDVPGGSQSDND